MRMFARILIALCAIAFLAFAPLSASAQSEQEVSEAVVQQLIPQTAVKFKISEDLAASYLRIALKAMHARKQAEIDKTEVSELYADCLDKLATTQLLQAVVLTRGNKLVERAKDGVPGTTIPQPLSTEINEWATLAAQSLVIGVSADLAGIKYAQEYALQSEACEQKQLASCADKLGEAMEIIKAAGLHTHQQASAISVVALAIRNLRY